MIIHQTSNSNYVIYNGSAITNSAGVYTLEAIGTRTGLFQPFPLSLNTNTAIRVSALVRLTSGTKGRVSAFRASSHDMNTATITLVDSIEITNTQWKRINFDVVYPLNTTDVLALVGFEVIQGEVSTIQVKDISMNVVDGHSKNKPEMVACGLIQKGAGLSPSVNIDFPNFNIVSVTFNGTDELTVTLNFASTLRKRPLILGNSTPDFPHAAVIGSVTAGNQTTFKIKFTDHGAGFVNISDKTVYVAFSAWL